MTSQPDVTALLASIERKIRALHHYGDPPDVRLQDRVDADVLDVLDDVRALLAAPPAEGPALTASELVHQFWKDEERGGRISQEEHDLLEDFAV